VDEQQLRVQLNELKPAGMPNLEHDLYADRNGNGDRMQQYQHG
jgi:hypothetical protein